MPRKPNPKEAIGHRIAEIRQSRGMTQQELGDAIGASNRMICHYEQGWPPAYILPKIANALAVSLDELVGIDDSAGPANGVKSRRLLRRVQEIERLPKRDQQALIRTIDAFLTARTR